MLQYCISKLARSSGPILRNSTLVLILLLVLTAPLFAVTLCYHLEQHILNLGGTTFLIVIIINAIGYTLLAQAHFAQEFLLTKNERIQYLAVGGTLLVDDHLSDIVQCLALFVLLVYRDDIPSGVLAVLTLTLMAHCERVLNVFDDASGFGIATKVWTKVGFRMVVVAFVLWKWTEEIVMFLFDENVMGMLGEINDQLDERIGLRHFVVVPDAREALSGE